MQVMIVVPHSGDSSSVQSIISPQNYIGCRRLRMISLFLHCSARVFDRCCTVHSNSMGATAGQLVDVARTDNLPYTSFLLGTDPTGAQSKQSCGARSGSNRKAQKEGLPSVLVSVASSSKSSRKEASDLLNKGDNVSETLPVA